MRPCHKQISWCVQDVKGERQQRHPESDLPLSIAHFTYIKSIFIHIYHTQRHLRLGTLQRGGRRIVRAKGREFCEAVFPNNIRSYTGTVSPTSLPKRELNKEDNNGQAN